MRVSEQREGKAFGELEIAVFQAPLLIDRDGVLEERAHDAARTAAERIAHITPPVPVSLPGASGYRSEAEVARPLGPRALPYVYVFALAPHDLAANGGVLVTVRCATPEWPAAESILKSLRVLGRRGASANDAAETTPWLPLVGKRDDG